MKEHNSPLTLPNCQIASLKKEAGQSTLTDTSAGEDVIFHLF